MKSLTLIAIALTLSACGHATTTLDRELALKLADRPQVVVASSPAPIVNVNNYNGGTNTQASEPFVDTRTNCMESPIYDANGNLLRMKRHCTGSQ